MSIFLDFEKPILELENKINELRHLSSGNEIDIRSEVIRLEGKVDKLLRQLYSKLTPWQKVQVARHPQRPQFLDYLHYFVKDFVSLAGDRNYAEDKAIIGGLGKIGNHSVMIIGQQKGHDTESRLYHNFGMPKPEGYRKAQRLMKLADRYRLPIITFIDTPGAYPGMDAEERGQAEAIASSIETCLNINVPIISLVLGEGSSGGAIAIGAANKLMMLEHAIYSVISPEGCASILWRSATKASEAAAAQKLTAQDLLSLYIIDEIIPEPLGGAHRERELTLKTVENTLHASLEEFAKKNLPSYKEERRQKFLKMGTQF